MKERALWHRRNRSKVLLHRGQERLFWKIAKIEHRSRDATASSSPRVVHKSKSQQKSTCLERSRGSNFFVCTTCKKPNSAASSGRINQTRTCRDEKGDARNTTRDRRPERHLCAPH